MDSNSEFMPGDELLHPWSGAVSTRTLERCSALKNTGTTQESKWAEISKNIYARMATRHDVVGRVLQGFFFSEHTGGPTNSPTLAEVQARLKAMCEDVRRVRMAKSAGNPTNSLLMCDPNHHHHQQQQNEVDEEEEAGGAKDGFESGEVEAVSYVCSFMEKVLAGGETPSLLQDMVPLACRRAPIEVDMGGNPDYAALTSLEPGRDLAAETPVATSPADGVPPSFSTDRTVPLSVTSQVVGVPAGRSSTDTDGTSSTPVQPTLEAVFHQCLNRYIDSLSSTRDHRTTTTTTTTTATLASASAPQPSREMMGDPAVLPDECQCAEAAESSRGGPAGGDSPVRKQRRLSLVHTGPSTAGWSGQQDGLLLALTPGCPLAAVGPYEMALRYSALGLETARLDPCGPASPSSSLSSPPRRTPFPFGVSSMRDRRLAAVQSEETRGDATLIRPDTVIAAPAWKEEGEAVFNSSSSSDDDGDDKDETETKQEQKAKVALAGGAVTNTPSGGETTWETHGAHAEGEESKASGRVASLEARLLDDATQPVESTTTTTTTTTVEEEDSRTTYITNGELVMVRGRFEVRPLPEKKERQRKPRKIDLHFSKPLPQPPTSSSSSAAAAAAAVGAGSSISLSTERNDLLETTSEEDHAIRTGSPDGLERGITTIITTTTTSSQATATSMPEEGSEESRSGNSSGTAPPPPAPAPGRRTTAPLFPKRKTTATESDITAAGRAELPTSSSVLSSPSPIRSGSRSGHKTGGGKTGKGGADTTKGTKRSGGGRLPLSVVSVEGIPRKTREEMQALLMEWSLSPILRKAFLIGVEEPLLPNETS